MKERNGVIFEDFDAIYVNRDIVDHPLYKTHAMGLLYYVYFHTDADYPVCKKSLNAIARDFDMDKVDIDKELKALQDEGFIEVYKGEGYYRNFLYIACRDNPLIVHPHEDVYFNLEPYNFGARPRTEPGYQKWREKCLKRDNYTCQRCGATEGLCVHHIQSYKDFPKLRTKLSNGITLCKECHKKEHRRKDTNGRQKNVLKTNNR